VELEKGKVRKKNSRIFGLVNGIIVALVRTDVGIILSTSTANATCCVFSPHEKKRSLSIVNLNLWWYGGRGEGRFSLNSFKKDVLASTHSKEKKGGPVLVSK
jgi:hypothetical protein